MKYLEERNEHLENQIIQFFNANENNVDVYSLIQMETSTQEENLIVEDI